LCDKTGKGMENWLCEGGSVDIKCLVHFQCRMHYSLPFIESQNVRGSFLNVA
jgi:hypothetical protein